jgi:regulator of cell morphogenesis and NO signaling
MIDESGYTISEWVKKDYRAADVFRKYQLSYCCSGNIPLKSVCEAKGIDYGQLSEELRKSTRTVLLPNNLPFESWRPDFLVDFITHVHHAYIYQTLPELSTMLENFAVGHLAKFPELSKLTDLFAKLADILIQHNRHEDEIIFPYIKQIDSAYRRKEPYGNLFVRTLRKPLDLVEKGHQKIQELLDQLQEITNQFVLPEGACMTYQVIYLKLQELYNNLIQHKWMEHEVLFPAALAIEQKLLQF